MLNIEVAIGRHNGLCQTGDVMLTYPEYGSLIQEDLELVRKRFELFWTRHHFADDLPVPLLVKNQAMPGTDGSKEPKVEVGQCTHCQLDCK